ncbi:hypothetical protein ACVR05_09950 [Streptococcus caprae]|uniref:5-bromo-4-chloroindolyl phosphate hydrolysis protein n=1 Tax=Streptococcus caprae TaxID=1640501 RepID=A0ABV8CVJ7_9STRE
MLSQKWGLGSILSILFIIGILGDLEALVGLTVLGAMGYGLYKLFTRKSSLEKANIATRLQDLKDAIARADRQTKLLDSHLENKEYTQYAVLARDVLTQVEDIKAEALALKQNMDLNIYKRISKKASAVSTEISAQLEKLDVPIETAESTEEEKQIIKLAPEIMTTYTNIQRDHAAILDKIDKADNKAELTAIHETSMKRFHDILQGYLKIKESPKNFHNADERLELAKQAMEQFDLDLDQTLRELNESALSDFEVSLRMMTQKSHDLTNTQK